MSSAFSSIEKQSIFSLALVIGLRMIGLFLILPMFALFASDLKGATPFLVGCAMGVYGLTQAIFQIPFGTLSDYYGRKPLILFGFFVFIIGSLIAYFSDSITFMIIGRALQGMGAVGSTLLALMADLTRESQRTKAMAVAGITIGFSFSAAMLLGPLLTKWMSINSLFLISACLVIGAMFILCYAVPTPEPTQRKQGHLSSLPELFNLLAKPALLSLNFGIFILHCIFTATFIALPISLAQFAHLKANEQWMLYLPILLIAFLVSLGCIGSAEKNHQTKPYFIAAIIALLLSQVCFLKQSQNLSLSAFALFLFFSGFSLLEAFMPSLLSRIASKDQRGAALGVYSCLQFLGIFVGGVLGGFLFGRYNYFGVYTFCIFLSFIWLLLSFFLQTPKIYLTEIWKINSQDWPQLSKKLYAIPGVVEVTFIAEKSVAILKIEGKTAKYAEYLTLKDIHYQISDL